MSIRPWLPHDVLIHPDDLIGRTKSKAGHNNIVGFTLVNGKLLTAIGKRKHFQAAVKAHLIRPVAALYFAVVPGRRRSDPVIADIVYLHKSFK